MIIIFVIYFCSYFSQSLAANIFAIFCQNFTLIVASNLCIVFGVDIIENLLFCSLATTSLERPLGARKMLSLQSMLKSAFQQKGGLGGYLPPQNCLGGGGK